ncbi:hypothetical protein BOTCAL_0391g00010 [Botryotinia calthae]|uniref:Uncharacterized protein n=1 Tax=Botryotinia calthae TaxID=38488 RepID=A0A4Y8CRN1_9HELO|nr:hypothetical protein BOTCAL_0391g00010 [Botryotinia calthae]
MSFLSLLVNSPIASECSPSSDIDNFAKDYIKNSTPADIIDESWQDFDNAASSFKTAVTRVAGSSSWIEKARDPVTLRWVPEPVFDYDTACHAANLHEKPFDDLVGVQNYMKDLPNIRSFQSLDISESYPRATQLFQRRILFGLCIIGR